MAGAKWICVTSQEVRIELPLYITYGQFTIGSGDQPWSRMVVYRGGIQRRRPALMRGQ
jgi:hypothetical protein